MDDYGKLPLLLARIASLEQQVKGDRVLIEQLRQQVKMATRASEILKRAGSDTGPLPAAPLPVPQPRTHRRPRSRDVTYLRVIKVATIGVLAAGMVAGVVIPASSIVAAPARAAQMPHALCDPPGFAAPSQDAAWRLVMAPHANRVPCIRVP
jgi:hypothetical protein